MLICLIASLYFQNVALGSFTVVLCLVLAFYTFPLSGGITYPTGNNVSSTTNGNTTDTTVSDITTTFTDSTLAIVFILIAFYMTGQLIGFRNERKKNKEESID